MTKKEPTLAKLKENAQKHFNAYIRERDRDRDGKWTCICCGERTDRPNAAHYATVKLYPHLRYNEVNVNVSCIRCNMNEGNFIGYRKGMIDKWGLRIVEDIEAKATDPNINKVYTRETLLYIIETYKNKKI